tara:strand:+ start:699 stop:968 length:270 start_codon:yes stop_codon:yes gene_type:complete
MILEIGLGLSITIAVLSLYVNWNLMRKTELLETWVEDFSDRISKVQQELTEIDSTGHFEADDEVGTIFESIKEVVNDISNFTEKESFSE